MSRATNNIRRLDGLKSLYEHGVVGDGVADDTAAVQTAITAGNATFLSGKTYKLTGNISIPANRTIVVEAGALVQNTGGRFTASGVDNVHWIIDGIVEFIATADGAQELDWPIVTYSGPGAYTSPERGLIEFGGTVATMRRGFSVSGGGIVRADFSGTPNASDQEYQVNRKGIACWNCEDVSITVSEVTGIHGEAVYFNASTTACENIRFHGIHSHHNRFNGLNFNVSVPYRHLKIDKCSVDNCYTGIEASGGDVIGNTILECVYTGVLFGGGAGSSLRQIKDNIVNDIQGTGYSLEYSLSGSVVQDLIITGNQALTCEGPGFACSKLDNFVFTDNFARNVNTGATPNRAFIFTQCTNGFVHNNFVGSPNGTNTTGVVELASCTQVLRGVNRGVVPITGDVTGAVEMQLTSASAPSYEHDGMTLHTTDGLTLKFRDKNGNVRTITHT